MTTSTAIILAAGRGSRMKNHTDQKPKCLVEVSGFPLIEWQIQSLKTAGITNIIIVGGYLVEKLKIYPVEVITNELWSSSNMLYSLFCAQNIIKEDFILSYSDIIFPSLAVSKLKASSHDNAICYDLDWLSQWEKRFSKPLEDAETLTFDIDERILSIGKTATDLGEIDGQYIGLTKLSTSFFDKVISLSNTDEIYKMDMTKIFAKLIDNGFELYGEQLRGNWWEIDNPKDLLLANELTNKGELLSEELQILRESH